MSAPTLYRGVWPQNVSKLAKYAVRFVDGDWRVTVFYETEEGLRYLAVEGGADDVAEMVNAVKKQVRQQLGGPFYVNEYRHVIVPVSALGSSGTGSHYYFAGRLGDDLTFAFEDQPLTTRPVRPDGSSLSPGDSWVGPRPGVPYVLAAGAGDIYYETPALTDGDPPEVRPRMTRKVRLSKVLGDASKLMAAVRDVAAQRGHPGGRFYVNEHGAMFTPKGSGDGNGLDYVYCGQLDLTAWFPEPRIQG
ncbi:MAG: hypothetical protein ACF8XB_06750 [Planctomycetota bacterium JB042]